MMSGAITGSSGRQASEARPFPASSGKRTKTAKSGFVEAFHDADGPAASRWQRTDNNTATTHWSGGVVARWRSRWPNDSASHQHRHSYRGGGVVEWRPCAGGPRAWRRAACVLRGGSPGFVDWEGRKADFIGIRPVHLVWTVVDGVTH